jgi:hypothetical protein
MRRVFLTSWLVASIGAVGCGGSTPRPDAPSRDQAHIEALVQEKCTTCHKAPKSASLARSDAETSVEKHKKKLQLGEPDWTAVAQRLTKN